MPRLPECGRLKIPTVFRFLPELLGRRQKKHEFLYWEFYSMGGRQAVRLGDWKGVRYNAHKNQGKEIEVFNLKDDIQEKNNIAQQYPEIEKKLRKIMEAQHVEAARRGYKWGGSV